MNIGIVSLLDQTAGGAYQYAQTMLESLARISLNSSEDFSIILSDYYECAQLFNTNHVNIGGIQLIPLDKLQYYFDTKNIKNILPEQAPVNAEILDVDPENLHLNNINYKLIAELELNLLIYSHPSKKTFENGHPYVAPVHDLQHKLQPEFPEVFADGEFDRREYLFRNLCRFACLILADSEIGREDILNCYSEYGVVEEMVEVLPFQPSNYLRIDISSAQIALVREEYSLPERYFFYPANFWEHKNHLRIIEAMHQLKESKGLSVELVLTGETGRAGDKFRRRTFDALLESIERRQLTSNVHYIGYVKDDHISALYAGAAGLVMPTFFGPTNIPILEAWAMDCPVITSDIRGVREQAGEAAHLVDPKSVDDIADGLEKLWCDEAYSKSLIDRGRKKQAEFTQADFDLRLSKIVDIAVERVSEQKYRVHPIVEIINN
jgi:glycosyltransferase involved in cell wall biosynthesis